MIARLGLADIPNYEHASHLTDSSPGRGGFFPAKYGGGHNPIPLFRISDLAGIGHPRRALDWCDFGVDSVRRPQAQAGTADAAVARYRCYAGKPHSFPRSAASTGTARG